MGLDPWSEMASACPRAGDCSCYPLNLQKGCDETRAGCAESGVVYRRWQNAIIERDTLVGVFSASQLFFQLSLIPSPNT